MGLGVHYSVDEDKILNAILSALWLLAAVTLCAISFFLNELAWYHVVTSSLFITTHQIPILSCQCQLWLVTDHLPALIFLCCWGVSHQQNKENYSDNKESHVQSFIMKCPLQWCMLFQQKGIDELGLYYYLHWDPKISTYWKLYHTPFLLW